MVMKFTVSKILLLVTLTLLASIADAQTAAEYYRAASGKFSAHDYSAAVEAFSSCIKLAPAESGCVGGRGMSYYNLKNYASAVADFATYIGQQPASDYGYFRRGLAYQQLEKYELALADYRAALKYKPDDPQIKKFVDALEGVVKTQQDVARAKEKVDKAQQKVNEAKADVDRSKTELAETRKKIIDAAEAAATIGVSMLLTKNYSGAVGAFTTCLLGVPTHILCMKNRGYAFVGLKKYDAAIADFTAILKLKPSRQIYTLRALTHRDNGNYQSAIADMTEAIKLEPKAAEYFFNRGAIYTLASDHTSAIADFTEAIRLDPSYINAYLARAGAYELKGTKDLAVADYQKVVQLRPENAEAKEALRKLTTKP